MEKEIARRSTAVAMAVGLAVGSASLNARAQLTLVAEDTRGHVDSVHRDSKKQVALISKERCNRFWAVVRLLEDPGMEVTANLAVPTHIQRYISLVVWIFCTSLNF